jgi:hypothetical protein
MNLSQRTSLSLLFMSLSAAPAAAALSDDVGSETVSIETVAHKNDMFPLDQLIGGDHSDLFESVLRQHAGAAQESISMMEGQSGSAGVNQPVLFGQRQLEPAGRNTPPAPYSEPAQVSNLSLSVAAHQGAQSESTPATVSSPSGNSPVSSNSISPNGNVPVTPPVPTPLPAAGLLLASGLAGLTGMRKRQE